MTLATANSQATDFVAYLPLATGVATLLGTVLGASLTAHYQRKQAARTEVKRLAGEFTSACYAMWLGHHSVLHFSYTLFNAERNGLAGTAESASEGLREAQAKHNAGVERAWGLRVQLRIAAPDLDNFAEALSGASSPPTPPSPSPIVADEHFVRRKDAEEAFVKAVREWRG